MRERPLVERVPLVVLNDHHDDRFLVAVGFVRGSESGGEPCEGAVRGEVGERQVGMGGVGSAGLEVAAGSNFTSELPPPSGRD